VQLEVDLAPEQSAGRVDLLLPEDQRIARAERQVRKIAGLRKGCADHDRFCLRAGGRSNKQGGGAQQQ
jgi:hypothetical protein